MAFDSVTILFIVITSFLSRTEMMEHLDVLFGVAILTDFLARLFISRSPLRELALPWTMGRCRGNLVVSRAFGG